MEVPPHSAMLGKAGAQQQKHEDWGSFRDLACGLLLDNVIFSFSAGFDVLNGGKERIREVALLKKFNFCSQSSLFHK